MRIIDMHCDTLIEGWRRQDQSFVDGDFSINLNLLKEGGSMVQFFAMYLSRYELKTMDPMDLMQGIYSYYQKVMAENKDVIRPVLCADDIEKNRSEGIISALLTVEDGVFVDGKMERIDQIYDMGVRLLTLLWGFENSMGYPCSDDPEVHMKGLTPFGIEVVERMNELGMIVDVSHLSEGGFYDVAKYSSKPFVASHSCARALSDHKRNLTDDQLRTLGNAGGIVGVNFERSFLKLGSEHSTMDQIIEHLAYMKDKAGIDAIGFGSDFDGIDDNGEMVNYGGFPRLLEKMEGTFTDDEIDKICYGNAMRVIRDIIG